MQDFESPLLTTVKIRFTKTKLGRFINSHIYQQPNRIGNCTPDICETLDNKIGSACCKLGYKCPLLSETACSAYSIRLRNCRVFPNNEDDLKLVKKCGYRFE